MIRSKVLASLIAFVLAFTSLTALTRQTYAQEPPAAESEENFQNSQRARSLIDLEAELSQTASIPVVCLARLKIVEFIFTKGVHEQFKSADRMATDCIDEGLRDNGPYSEKGAESIVVAMMSLLRAYSPKRASEIESNLPYDALPVNSSDYYYFKTDSQLKYLERVVVTQLQKRAYVSGLTPLMLHFSWKGKAQQESLKNSILEVWESQAKEGRLLSNAMSGVEYFNGSKPETRIRYLKLLTEVAQKTLQSDGPKWYLFNMRQTLAGSLSQIKRELPEKYLKATSTLQLLTAKLDKEQRAHVEDWDRYIESKGDLEKSIEALKLTSTDSAQFNLLGVIASRFASSGDYKSSIDAYLARNYPNPEDQINHVNLIRINLVPRIVETGKLELIEYAAERISDRNARALLLLSTSKELGGDDTRSLTYFTRAMEQLKSSPASRSKLYCLSEAYVFAKSIKRKEYREIEDLIFASANELLATGRQETKVAKDTGEEKLLVPANFLFGFVYLIAKKDIIVADEMLPRIQHPAVRTLAEISVEMFRKYPQPADEKQKQDEQGR